MSGGGAPGLPPHTEDTPAHEPEPASVAELADELLGTLRGAARRHILGLAGPPGAGKSTLALHLVAAVERRLGPGSAAYLPLDGFHLSSAQLARMSLADRRGAPATFDVWGYAALLGRIVGEPAHPVYVPDYDRDLNEPVAARHTVLPRTRLVVTEGNYLALDTPGWREARWHIDELWYVDTADEVRHQRLVRRQLDGGLDVDAAHAWVRDSDGPNGETVKASRSACRRSVVPGQLPPLPDPPPLHP